MFSILKQGEIFFIFRGGDFVQFRVLGGFWEMGFSLEADFLLKVCSFFNGAYILREQVTVFLVVMACF